MSGIVEYIGSKVLEELINEIKNTEGQIKIIEEKLDFIDEKLERLIAAPYKEAIMYYRRGNLEKFEEKLTQAIANDDFNIPARLAYIALMISEKRYDIAIQNYWELFDIFGYMKGIASNTFMKNHFSKSICNIGLAGKDIHLYPRDKAGQNLDDRRFVPLEIWISNSLVCIKWEYTPISWYHFTSYTLTLFNLKKNKEIFRIKDYSDICIRNLTNDYLFFQIGDNKAIINKNGWRISNRTVDFNLFNDLFRYNQRDILSNRNLYNMENIDITIRRINTEYNDQIWGDGTGFHDRCRPYKLYNISIKEHTSSK